MEKNIHQIWLGEKRIPKHLKEWMDEIKKNHPDFKYFFWNDSNIPEMPSSLKQVFDSLDHPAMKSDLLRLYVLKLYGGIYLDTDYKLINNLNNLNCFNNNKNYVVYHKHEKVEEFCNSVLVSSKNSDFINYAINKINQPGMWLGPHFYAECVYKYLNLKAKCNYKNILNKLDDLDIGYIDWNFIDNKIAKHNFLASWYPGSEWKEKLDTGNYE